MSIIKESWYKVTIGSGYNPASSFRALKQGEKEKTENQ